MFLVYSYEMVRLFWLFGFRFSQLFWIQCFWFGCQTKATATSGNWAWEAFWGSSRPATWAIGTWGGCSKDILYSIQNSNNDSKDILAQISNKARYSWIQAVVSFPIDYPAKAYPLDTSHQSSLSVRFLGAKPKCLTPKEVKHTSHISPRNCRARSKKAGGSPLSCRLNGTHGSVLFWKCIFLTRKKRFHPGPVPSQFSLMVSSGWNRNVSKVFFSQKAHEDLVGSPVHSLQLHPHHHQTHHHHDPRADERGQGPLHHHHLHHL